jgi:hypothetical protein
VLREVNDTDAFSIPSNTTGVAARPLYHEVRPAQANGAVAGRHVKIDGRWFETDAIRSRAIPAMVSERDLMIRLDGLR